MAYSWGIALFLRKRRAIPHGLRLAAARSLFLAFAAAFFLHPPLAEAPVAQGNPHAEQENHCQHSKIHFYLIVDKPLVCQRICPTACLRTVSPTAAQCSGAAHCVCSRLQPLRGLQRPAVGAGMHFYVSHRPSIQHGRSTALASSLVALPASLGLLRPVSATGGGLRAPLRFACAVFRRCGRPLGVSSRLQPFGPSPFRKRLLCKKCQK